MEISSQGNAVHPGRTGREQGLADRLQQFAIQTPTRRIAYVVFGGIAVMAILGTFQRLGWGFGLFDLDGEGKPAPAWSALVLAGAGTLALLLSRMDGELRLPWRVLGFFFLFMALDECATLHEHAETATKIDWQYLWSPIVLVGGVAWLAGLRRIWPLSRERMLLMAGAACWLIAQIDEHFQSNPDQGRVAGYGALSAVEEILEVTGSALFLLALLGVVKAIANRDRRLAESPA
jgi:hypothetical protein